VAVPNFFERYEEPMLETQLYNLIWDICMKLMLGTLMWDIWMNIGYIVGENFIIVA